MGALGPRGQPARGGVAAGIPAVLGAAAQRASQRAERWASSEWAGPQGGRGRPPAPRSPWPLAGRRGQERSGGGRGRAGRPDPRGGRPRVEGGGRWWAPRTWGWPQSHCSPRSTKPFPHTGPPTRRSGSGALARQPVREFSTNLSRSTWLHWLNLLGNGELRGRACHQGAGGGGRDTAPPTPGSGPRPGWTSLTQCGPP